MGSGLINAMPSVMKVQPHSHEQEKVEEPKQPPSAYNLFFQVERKRILNGTDQDDTPVSFNYVRRIREQEKEVAPKRVHRKTHGKIGFRELTCRIAAKWKKIDPESRKVYDDHARLAKEEYVKKREAWKAFVGEDEARRYKKNKKSRSAKKAIEEAQFAEQVASSQMHEVQSPTDKIRSAISKVTLAGHKMETLERLFDYTTKEIAKLQSRVDGIVQNPEMGQDSHLVSLPCMSIKEQRMEALPFDTQQGSPAAVLFPEVLDFSGPQGTLEDFMDSSIFHDAFKCGYDLCDAMEPVEFEMIFVDC